MRTAFLADIHANSDALVAVLTDIRCRGIRKVVHLGDVVGYNTRPCETSSQRAWIGGVVGDDPTRRLTALPGSPMSIAEIGGGVAPQ